MPGDMAIHGWFDRIRSRFTSEKAQTMAEYAVLAVITPAIIIAYSLFSDRIAQLFDSVRALLA